MGERENERFCVIVPAFHEEKHIAPVVAGIRRHCADVIVVDDGSADETSAKAKEAGAAVVRHPRNLGKGAALNTGFKAAVDKGYGFVITMDADGQHDPEDIPAFVKAFRAGAGDVLVGNRMDRAHNMPLHRKLTNLFMSWLLSRFMGQFVPDTQCGYRLIGARALPNMPTTSQRFAAESEVLLALAEQGMRFGSVPIKVIYGDERSKINPVLDTWRFIRMLHGYRKARNARRRQNCGSGGPHARPSAGN